MLSEMRWVEKVGPYPGQHRIIKKFLLFPKLLGGQWRWLEVAEIEQR